MQIEDVARIRLAAGRSAQQQTDFAVGHGLLRQVVVDDERRTACVSEIFADGCTGEWRVELHGGRVRRRRRHDAGVGHGAVLFQRVVDLRHRAAFLPYGYIDAVHRLAGLVERFLVQNRVDGNGRLAGLPVADDELALAATDGYHRVNGLDARLQRLFHRLPEDYLRRLALQRHLIQVAIDVPLAVQRLAQRIDHAADNAFAHTDRSYSARPFHRVAFSDVLGRTHQHYADAVLLQVHHDTRGRTNFNKFVGLGIAQTVGRGNAVAHSQYCPDFLHFDRSIEIVKLFFQQFRYLRGFYVFHSLPF